MGSVVRHAQSSYGESKVTEKIQREDTYRHRSLIDNEWRVWKEDADNTPPPEWLLALETISVIGMIITSNQRESSGLFTAV